MDGTGWANLPERFPSSSTCYRWFSRWVKTGTLRTILEALARHGAVRHETFRNASLMEHSA
ncbi:MULTISPECIES: transposase [Bilophila]|uniref:transposase n=1 Tax=Bilophila TaxID=35832 RepID=UPI0033907751